jgi:hypothetical protein
MEYASVGDLHKNLQNNFTNITWNKKINILSQISLGYYILNIFIMFSKFKLLNFFFI